jgi:carboxypeptidase Taq
LVFQSYDALLDQYDEGRKSADIDKIFADLKTFLPGFIEQVMSKQSKQKQPVKPSGHYPIEKQKEISIELMKLIGFDFDKGRLDVSAHPFSGGTPDDVRITTRYNEKDYTDSLMSVFHETGHAMYSFGQPLRYRNQPVGNRLA